jgi:hypothetical protein
MSYGYSKTSYRGNRSPRYVWQPSFAPAKRKRRHKGARPYHRRTDNIDLSDHFRRPWLHDYEPKDWKGGDFLDYVIRNDPRFAGVRLLNFLLYHCFLMVGLAVVGIGYLILSIGQAEKKRQVREETSRKALRLGRRSSIHEPPTPERLREAWNISRTSLEGKLLLGSLLSDIEPVVDRSYIRTEGGTIVGRKPGVKGWLSLHCPDLVPHYKALMGYKALADKMRLALGVSDPDSLEEALVIAMKGQTSADAEANAAEENSGGQTSGQTSPNIGGQTPQEGGNSESEERGFGPKSMAKNYDVKLLNKIDLNRAKEIHLIIHGLARPTMGALEAAVREKLGLVWMVRKRARRRVA